jgi:hypothetical protein
MKRLLTPAVVLTLLISSPVFAQELDVNCTQTLRTARNTYDQGRLHEIPQILQKCLANGFTETEKIEALKILVQTYIYLEEPGEADKAMLTLLQTDHFFIPNDQADPIEFISLYKKFRTKPVWRAGIKFGGLTNFVSVIQNHYVWVESQGKGKYSSKIGTQFGATFEKDLNDRFVLNPEVFYSTSSYTYSNSAPLRADDPASLESGGSLTTMEVTDLKKQTRTSLNVLVQYKIGKLGDITDNFIPFVAIGPSLSYLNGSQSSITTNVTQLVTGEAVKTKTNYRPVTFSAIAVAGTKLRLGGLYITADVRLQFGIGNVVDKNNRFRWQGETADLARYGVVDNDFRLSSASFNLGIMIPKFSPKKLIK